MGFKLVSLILTVTLTLVPLAWGQEKPRTEPASAPEERVDPWESAAGVATVVYFPGKVVLCGLGAIGGLAALFLTFGSGYRAAARVWEEGCGGPWVLTAGDLKPDASEENQMWSEKSGFRR